MICLTLGKKLMLGCGILLSLFVVIGLILYFETKAVSGALTEIVDKGEPKNAAAYEMEIHSIGTAIGILNYLFNTDMKSREDVEMYDRGFKLFHAEYLKRAKTDKEKEFGAEIDQICEEFKPVGESLMYARDYQKDLFAEISGHFNTAHLLLARLDATLSREAGPESAQKLQKATEMKLNLSEVGNWLGNYLRTRKSTYRQRIADNTRAFLINLKGFESFTLTEAERALVKEIQQTFSRIHFITSEIIGIEYAFDKYLSRFTELRTRLHQILHGRVKTLARDELEQAKRAGIHAAQRARWIIMVVILVAICFGSTIVILLTMYLTRSLKTLVSAAERLGKGYLSERVKIMSKDELGTLGGAFNQMAEDLERYIFEKTEIEHSLRESEEKYSNLFLCSNDAIIIHNFEGGILDANEKAMGLFGYSKPQMITLMIENLYPPYAVEKLQAAFETIKEHGVVSFEIDFVKRDGQVFPAEVSSSLFEIADQKVIQWLIRDITERIQAKREVQQLEDKVKHAERMEAIGTLAGGVAHDFNNLLMGIQGNVSLMLMDINDSYPHHERLKNIEQYVQSGAALTKQLLGFARGGKYEVKPTDLNSVINKTAGMFGRTRKDIKIHQKLYEHLWAAEVDQGQIEQVLLNLYVNAWQAMPGGGELFLQSENVVLDEDYVKPFGVEPGNYVKISVTDTGIGMDEATRLRVFDPFFTTKEIGRGTGLGLASAYGIIKNHGGVINVYSEKGEGTTFNLYLPAFDKEFAEAAPSKKEILRGSETILLVDDEKMIIDVGTPLLDRLGYKVLVARSGSEALKIYEENLEEIDMVILDMIMPDMNGRETYEKMKVLDPSIKVLLASGYSIKGQAQAILDRGCQAFIQKPFNISELSIKVREILDNKS